MNPNTPEAPTEPALLRSLIAHPLTRLLLYVLTPLGAGAILLKALWLGWTALDWAARARFGGLLLGVAGLIGLGGCSLLRRWRPGRPFFGWTLALGAATLWGWGWELSGQTTLDALPAFAFDFLDAMTVLWCLAPSIVGSLAWLFCQPRFQRDHLAPFFARVILSFIACGFCVLLCFVAATSSHNGVILFLSLWFVLSLILIGWLFFLFGLVDRFLKLGFFQRQGVAWALRAGGCLLALLGLWLNRTIPFPATFQTPSIYGLWLAASLFILLPPREGASARCWFLFGGALLPFSLYFFTVFLPLLPLVLPGCIVFGGGLLLLAPLCFLLLHLGALTRCARQADFRRPRTPFLLATLTALLLPLAFLVQTERDRAEVHALIDALAKPDYTAAADTVPLPPEVVARAGRTTLDLTEGYSLPLLSAWRKKRIFGGMRPRRETLEAIRARLNASEIISFDFADLFQSQMTHAATNPQRWSPPTTSQGVQAAFKGPTDGRRLTVALTITPQPPKHSWESAAPDFAAPVTLAEGVWVTGLRLKLPNGGDWKEATRRDRRVATWVYESLRSAEGRLRLDPALLVLDSATHGRLAVAPLTEAREVEIDLLMPEPYWCERPIAIGSAAPELPRPEGAPEPVWVDQPAATVFLIAPGTAGDFAEVSGPALYLRAGQEIRVSETPPAWMSSSVNQVDAERAIRFARGNLYARGWRVGEVHFVGRGWEKVRNALPPEPPHRQLPKLPPDDPWQLGAQAWQLAEALEHSPALPHREAIRELANRAHILTPSEALIVVETDAQERGLAAADRAHREVDSAFTILDDPTPQDAPAFLLLLALLALALYVRRVRHVRQ